MKKNAGFNLEEIFNNYDKYSEHLFKYKRIKHSDVLTLSKKIGHSEGFSLTPLGTSVENREIIKISFGKGPINILCWSQMHGNESTATMAIFDVLNFISQNDYQDFLDLLSNSLTIHFIPMLNPDGAERFIRENALNIDLNRDALKLESPESIILKRLIDELKPLFGFNLHDQKIYYSAGYSRNPATISFLAPAYNFEKDINPVRRRAMQLIAQLSGELQRYIPDSIGRYDDEFEPRAFGDNIMKWGTSTILIESGGHKNDPEKQFIRKINFISLLFSFYSIAAESYKNYSLDLYDKIPENRERLFDLKINDVCLMKNDKKYKIDIGINRTEVTSNDSDKSYYNGTIEEIGDLSTYYGYEEFDGSNLQIYEAEILMESVSSINEINLINSGYLYINQKQNNKVIKNIINIFNNNIPSTKIKPEAPANFYLVNDNLEKKFAVINGFLVKLDDNKVDIPNCINFF